MTNWPRILDVVSDFPGATSREIAERLFGEDGYSQRVTGYMLYFVRDGEMRREGAGVSGDPYRYWVMK